MLGDSNKFFEKKINNVDLYLKKISNLTNLRELSLGSIYDLSPLANIANLSSLSIKYLHVTDLTPLENLIHLTNIFIENSQVFNISPLTKLFKLNSILIISKVLSDLSPLQNLTNLSKICFINSQVSDLSPIANLTNLTTLHIDSTQVSDLSPIANLTNLTTLHIDSTQVSDLSPIANLTNLTTLHLGFTKVSDLSPIANLTNLTIVKCNNTIVEDLTPLKNLVNLTKLNIDFTQTDNLLPLKRLSKLSYVNVEYTKVFDLSSLENLINLEYLNISNTKTTDLLPLSGLTELQTLYCNNTLIANLSPLSNLSNLKQLQFYNTKVTDLSPILFLLEKNVPIIWEYIRNDNGIISDYSCPLIHPPIEIAKQGNDAILNYFRERDAAKKTIPLREAKLILLGVPGAGKTTLATKIKDIQAPMPAKDKSTRGIEVQTLRIGEGEGAFDIHIWDFGGQQIYHGTHRFFLTKRSLYVVVADNRKQDTDFNYWMQMAELYGGSSPLYVVVNQSDDRPPYPNASGMRERFDILKEMLAANLDTLDETHDAPGSAIATKNTKDTKRIIDTLKSRIQELPHVGQELPEPWFDIRRALDSIHKTEKKDYVSLERYYDICEKNGIAERERKLYLSAYLHDLGAILHFQEDAALRETVILSMSWATDAVFAAYDSPLVNSGERPGFFKQSDIEAIWREDRYCDKQAQLLAMMMRFKLCYRIGESGDYVVPELLPYAQPDYATNIPALNRENLDKSPAVFYEYEFMPKGIFARLAVEVHRLIAWKQQFIWREGAVLQSGESYALVTETYGNRKIVVRAVGRHRRELMTIVTHRLDEIHATFPKIRVKKLVPCDCATCQKEKEPHYYDFKNLQDRLERRKFTVECAKSFEAVPVRRLLDAVFQQDEKPIFVEKRLLDAVNGGSIRIFISYSKSDKSWLDKLNKHLAVLIRQEKIEVWYDEQLPPGSNWDLEIKNRLSAADIILFLVSPDFLATDYIWDVEIKTAIERDARGEVKAIPVILRPSDWLKSPLAKLSALPLKGKPISQATDEDEAYVSVILALREEIEKIKSKKLTA